MRGRDEANLFVKWGQRELTAAAVAGDRRLAITDATKQQQTIGL